MANKPNSFGIFLISVFKKLLLCQNYTLSFQTKFYIKNKLKLFKNEI